MQVATANLADAKNISMFAALVGVLSEPDNERRVKKQYCNPTRGSCSQYPPAPVAPTGSFKAAVDSEQGSSSHLPSFAFPLFKLF